MLLIINYGGQTCHLISKRIRSFNVYSEILPYNTSLEQIKKMKPDGIILSGGPSSVYGQNSPLSDKGILELGIPVLGICYGQQLIGMQLGGEVAPNKIKEYGKKILRIKSIESEGDKRGDDEGKKKGDEEDKKGGKENKEGIKEDKKGCEEDKKNKEDKKGDEESKKNKEDKKGDEESKKNKEDEDTNSWSRNRLFKSLKSREVVWMSHGDSVEKLPKGFVTLASTDSCKNASIGNPGKNIYGVQFHPEVTHTPNGAKILKNFVFGICRAKKDFSLKGLSSQLINSAAKEIGEGEVIMGVSGGVDSTVAAVLLNKAVGKRLHCIFINHGLARKNEMKIVRQRYEGLALNVKYVDAADIFLKRLKGVTEPEEKRKAIANTFIGVFEREAGLSEEKHRDIRFLAQGTIYPDRIESAQPSKESSKIKSHHNVVLPEKMKLKVIEPLKELYKDDVRKLGRELNIPEELLRRHPFPGPGLAVRIIGEVTKERIRMLQEADHIFILELKKNSLYNKVWQAFAVLLPLKTVGVMGDARTYGHIISLRAVTSTDAMTADWAKLPYPFLEHVSNRIINEVKGVNRVVYDISQKPPATIEYE